MKIRGHDTVEKTNSAWNSTDFADIKGIFELFKAAGYIVGGVNPVDEDLMEIYKVVDELKQNFHVWVIVAAEAMHNKDWRRAITERIAQSSGDYVIFYTTTSYSTYYLAIICDIGICEVKFFPSNPAAAPRFILNIVLSKRPLTEISTSRQVKWRKTINNSNVDFDIDDHVDFDIDGDVDFAVNDDIDFDVDDDVDVDINDSSFDSEATSINSPGTFRCPKCSNEFSRGPNVSFCPYCGEELKSEFDLPC